MKLPDKVYVTRDRRYGIVEMHLGRLSAERERARAPSEIDIIAYRRMAKDQPKR